MHDELRIDRIDHLYVTVRDLARSERFYDPVMRALGFRKGTAPIAGEPHVHYFNAQMQYSLRGARTDAPEGRGPVDRYRPGALHHLCFQVATVDTVDEAFRRLRALGIEASEPRRYPEYRPDYHAFFFADPDGIQLEVVCDTVSRRIARSHWHELSDFEDPLGGLRKRRPELWAELDSPDDAGAVERVASTGDGLVAGNLWRDVVPPAQGERFDVIASLGDVKIERILSSRRPDGSEYDQAHDEWVLLLRGRASLEVEGERVELRAGDHLLLRAHTRHRVLETSDGALWLALHHAPSAGRS